MKLFLLIPAIVAAVTLEGTTMQPLQDTEVVAGDKYSIPCDLKNVRLIWYWIPRYPICADLKMGLIEICSVISNTTYTNEMLKRFQKMRVEENNGNFSLIVPLQHMNDSGTFYCFDGRKNSSFISIVVKSDNRRGMEVTKNSHGSEQEIKLTCNSCDHNLPVRGHKKTSITWTLNGKKVNDDIHVKKLKNVYFVKDNPQYYGLWKCSNARCPTQSDGYCLEKESRVSERSETEEMPWSTPAPLDTGKKLMIQIIVGCVIGIIALLGMVVTIFVLWQKLLSRRTSPNKSAKEPKSQVIQNSFDLEKPLENQGKEKDIEMNEGAEGIQYSVLQLKEPEQCQSQRKEGTPAIIYAEMPTSNCSKS